MTIALRQFFESQPDCIISALSHGGKTPVRDIFASCPYLAIAQNALIGESKRNQLQRLFPNTTITSRVDSRIDQARLNEARAGVRENASKGFEFKDSNHQGRITKLPSREKHHSLTGKEMQVLQLLDEGSSYTKVSIELLISYETLRTHVQHIYAKLGVNRVNEILAKARNEKLVK